MSKIIERIGKFEAEDRYENFLNESYPPIEIFGTVCGLGKCLKLINPALFHAKMVEWLKLNNFQLIERKSK